MKRVYEPVDNSILVGGIIRMIMSDNYKYYADAFCYIT